ncbi:hypothetical protein Tcan_06781 [Toxocara canis]|uniref:Uncharacterized protein n=1 Tax=Toxocara canis TaxID=6265 RepID=A0A0B2VHJ4_TOXCA|nr:hypothetical protein Tcan_06781 [Toxocara canis]
MAVHEVFANLLLALFGLIGSTEGGHHRDPIVVLAEMIGISAEQLYREIGLFVVSNYHEISALDTGNKGIDYYVAEAAAHRFHTLLMEAACRAKGVQLLFWSTGQVSCMLFGLQGPLYSMINNGRERIGLRGEPMIPACVRSHKLGGCRRIRYELGELVLDERETSPNNGLWRMAEQAPLPDDQPQPGPSNEPDQAPQAGRKRPRSLAEQMLEEFTKRARED